MTDIAVGVVLFVNTLEEGGSDKHFGILFENGFILCLSCGGCFEPEDYEILKHYEWSEIDDLLLDEYLWQVDDLI